MKAVLQFRASPALRERAARLSRGGLQVVIPDETDPGSFARELQAADVLLHVLDPVTAGMIESAPGLRLIQKIGVGVNTIDLEAARARGIAVCNMPGTNTQAVAEMTLLLMLATLRRLAYLDRLVRVERGWALDPVVADGFGELAGRTVGLVGFGAVPRRLAPILQAMGARVACTGRRPPADASVEFLPLDRLLSQADIVSLHLPATAETERILDAAAFRRMRPGSILINTARGQLVDEDALYEALTRGHLRGAGLDVLRSEPARGDNRLFALPNVTVAPHVAWLTLETLDRSLAVIEENCRRLGGGEELLHRVA